MSNESSNHWKLGLFVVAGILLFVVAIYFVGMNRNLFGSNFVLRTEFKNVSGLKQGSNVLLSGINVGTVNKIDFVSDSLVLVKLVIKKEVQQYIKTDAIASIGSDGLVGDKVLIISPGTSSNIVVQNNDLIASFKTIAIEDILLSVKKSADNTKIITDQLIQFSTKMNDKNGLLVKIMTDKDFASRIDNTIANLQFSAAQLAAFTPSLQNKDGVVSNLLTNKEWSSSIKGSITDLQNSTKEISTFSAQLNDKNNLLSKMLSNDTVAVSMEKAILNLEKSAAELATFTSKMNNDSSVLSKLIDNPRLGKSVDSTLINLEKRVKELKELEAAARSNFLLKGYFTKKKREEAKQKEEK